MREYGIQMYSVRDITEKDMPGALRALAEMGYKNVEFAFRQKRSRSCWTTTA